MRSVFRLPRGPTGPLGEPSAAGLAPVPAAPAQRDERVGAVAGGQPELRREACIGGSPVREEPSGVTPELREDPPHQSSGAVVPARKDPGSRSSLRQGAVASE